MPAPYTSYTYIVSYTHNIAHLRYLITYMTMTIWRCGLWRMKAGRTTSHRARFFFFFASNVVEKYAPSTSNLNFQKWNCLAQNVFTIRCCQIARPFTFHPLMDFIFGIKMSPATNQCWLTSWWMRLCMLTSNILRWALPIFIVKHCTIVALIKW